MSQSVWGRLAAAVTDPDLEDEPAREALRLIQQLMDTAREAEFELHTLGATMAGTRIMIAGGGLPKHGMDELKQAMKGGKAVADYCAGRIHESVAALEKLLAQKSGIELRWEFRPPDDDEGQDD